MASSECLIQGEHYRISVLTGRLIRLEYSENGSFEDGATQKIVNRSFPVPWFRVIDQEEQLDIVTEELQITYDKKRFTKNGLSIRLNRNTYSNHSIWHYGEQGDNLKGTARTLDAAEGAVELEDGLLAYNGYSVLDDSESYLISEDGWVHAPIIGHTDLYFFGYGHAYLDCLKDFFCLCGSTPMLPRYALGNWWSRYHAYTQKEYMDLMDRFAMERLPFSVAVFDMDWHYVKLDEKYGNGWTGYSWNRQLFPDHVKMLRELKDRGLHITLNIHPADGVRGHEDAYRAMAQALGVDYENEVPISFDIADRDFMEAYFKYLHHPLEEEGVDFWWVDWQQGNTTKFPGLDPLWMLNHFYYQDNKRNGKRPLIFSRYAGIGSHRYPIGFSGDTIISWKTLEYQPYFTATASNAGYGWWSHDIGGHMNGYRDDELATRWLQFGVFSPIMRLHSSCNLFTGKEPWKFGVQEERIMSRYLRLRHQLIPYLYTMNERFQRKSLPLIRPMYYEAPDRREAYEVPNQYRFGTELLVHPITSKMDPDIKAGKVVTWLPEGIWYDIFSGLRYKGDRSIIMYRTLEDIPVLAKAGSILPMQQEADVSGITDNPVDLTLLVFAGESGEFTMYEDDGISLDCENGAFATTKYSIYWEDTKHLTIHPAEGDLSLIPPMRNYEIRIYGLPENSIQEICINGEKIESKLSYDKERCIQTIAIDALKSESMFEISLEPSLSLAENQIAWRLFRAINMAQIEYQWKEKLYNTILNSTSVESMISDLMSMTIRTELKELIQEIVLASPRNF